MHHFCMDLYGPHQELSFLLLNKTIGQSKVTNVANQKAQTNKNFNTLQQTILRSILPGRTNTECAAVLRIDCSIDWYSPPPLPNIQTPSLHLRKL